MQYSATSYGRHFEIRDLKNLLLQFFKDFDWYINQQFQL